MTQKLEKATVDRAATESTDGTAEDEDGRRRGKGADKRADLKDHEADEEDGLHGEECIDLSDATDGLEVVSARFKRRDHTRKRRRSWSFH